jgi:hypothetical protein
LGEPTVQKQPSLTVVQFVWPPSSPPPPLSAGGIPMHAVHDVAMHAPRLGDATTRSVQALVTPLEQPSSDAAHGDWLQQPDACDAHALAMHAPHAASSPPKWHAAVSFDGSSFTKKMHPAAPEA